MHTSFLTIPNYTLLEVIHEGDNTVVYRGRRDLDRQPVIIKQLKERYPALEQIARLKYEYKITANLDLPGIVKAYSLETFENYFALVLEDFGGVSLRKLQKGKTVKIDAFLRIAIQIVQAIALMHQHNIIHKDIKPHNIIINPETNEVKITDFSIATRLSRETQAAISPDSLEGTLAYISPEQTGRMNRSLDYRSDFYSLGITFYEMLTGKVPCQSNDPLELIHCHIAQQPVPPHEINPEIPQAISDITMKLLAKTAEHRYQSANGLKADLEHCLNQLQLNGYIPAFIPGELDQASQLLIPQILYGRRLEVAKLMSAFERICHGGSEIVLVSGYSGIGKSSLINEVHKPIVRQRGYFISGKFDQFNRNIPYSALIQAFQELIGQLLAEGANKLQGWKTRLTNALANNGQAIIEVIPELELLIGKQPEISQLGTVEAQNRFNQVFTKFIQIFTKPEHPLVLFLDDLQWADSASLKLIQQLISDTKNEYLLLIGAYRDNEVSPDHILMQTLEELEKKEITINSIVLQPLKFSHVSQLVADTLKDKERTQQLAELLFNKTQGNPFFLTQMLKTLHQEDLLTFDFIEQRWIWNIDRIQSIGITDQNVVELVANNIQKLPVKTQEVLKLAACIGNTFSLEVLQIVNKKTIFETVEELWEALQAGLVLPLNKNYDITLLFSEIDVEDSSLSNLRIEYKFLHDRVQQAAYSLIPEAAKQTTHLEIGRSLLKNAYSEDKIFDIVNQINFGIDLIAERQERDELAQLNLKAGRKAKAAMAYSAAAKYLEVGIKTLGADGWQRDYTLMLALHEEAAETQFLNQDLERAQNLAEIVLLATIDILDKVKIYELQIQFNLAQNQVQTAVERAQQILSMLGVSLSERLPKKLSAQELLNLPEMTDPYKLAAMRILTSVVDASAGFPSLFRVIVLTMVNLCIEHGNSWLSAYTFAVYSWLLCGALEEIEAGYEYGQLSLSLADKFGAKELRCKIYELFNAFVRHWKEPAKTTIQPLKDEIQGCLEVGNKEYACFSAMHYCTYLVLVGEPLDNVLQKQQVYIEMMATMQRELQLTYSSVWHQLVLNLMGKAANKYLLVSDKFDETTVLPELQAKNSSFSIFSIYVAKLILSYLLKDYQQAMKSAEWAVVHEVKAGLLTTGVHNFYYSLALLALFNQKEGDDDLRSLYLEQVAKNQEKLQEWATHAPSNYQHKYDLVEAEMARILGQTLMAMDYYELAIKGARNQGYIQEEALAYELAAEFYLGLGREEIAQMYMTRAYYGYIQWDALVKVKDLEERYPQLIYKTFAGITSNVEVTHHKTTISTTGRGTQGLDFSTIIKSAQALSGEIVLSNLLSQLMKIAIENAGAQTGSFVTKQDDDWVIEVTGSIEREDIALSQEAVIANHQDIPISIINFVDRTQKHLVIDNAINEDKFAADPYISTQQPKSILCMPVLHQGKLNGILYLENNLVDGAFTADRLAVLKVLTTQVSISIENARLYRDSQIHAQELEKKNAALKSQTERLEQTLQNLQKTQSQLVQTEKISSLGQLVAGVAHEVNNPVGFINGNLEHAKEYTQDLIELLELYQQHFPNPPVEIIDKAEEIELEYLLEDLPKILSSMKVGTERIRDIMSSLRTFSRTDTGQKLPVNIHEGIDSTLLILQHRLKAKPERPAIKLVKEYGELPKVECFAGQLNQVFMNILANAIDVLDEDSSKHSYTEIERNPNIIRIKTEVINEQVVVHIADNGPGMPETVKEQLFAPFFTTKPAGKGTGLGLSISHQIVTETHGGALDCISAPGEGAEFVISIPLG